MRYFAHPLILQNANDAELAWDAIAPFWEELPYASAKLLPKFMSSLTKGQRGLVSLDWCQKEIRNGGMKQLFANSTGNLVPWALEGFSLIGAHSYRQALEEGAVLLGVRYPDSASTRKKALASLSASDRSRLNELDDAFFKLLQDPTTDLEGYRGKYVRHHPEEFVWAA
jgi:hypothetical protein